MFLLVSGSHICTPERDTNMASPYKALLFWAKRFKYLVYEILPDLILVGKALCMYLPSFISQILDFLY